MTAYYNEFDKHAAAWLRELIKRGLIAQGDVDERSIVDVSPDDLRGFDQCHFFAGLGAWSYALRLAGWDDARPVWTASLPCQPFSAAGEKRGAKDERNLLEVWLRLVEECRPPVCIGEQVEPAIGLNWLDALFIRLEQSDYACGSAVFPAASVGAPHRRERLYWVAQSSSTGTGRYVGGIPRTQPASRWGHGPVVTCSPACELADAERSCDRGEKDAADHGWPQAFGPADRAGGCGGASGLLGDTPGKRCTRVWNQSTHSSVGQAGAVNGFWADAIWLPCRDQKWRPTQPGVEPLVDGSAVRVGPGGDSGTSLAEVLNTSEARVMRLRGYGNAIVAPQAAEFLASYMGIKQ